ncbi:MAG: hypothetical protein PF439_11550 [Helicobacteraceae bacterium]|jgi:hypothetical protein|nr:hypothetical protein [Helicobacteraceae bacterium]
MLKHLSTLLFAALLMVGLTTLNAADMKCGAGKCGSTMSKDMTQKGCTKCKDCPNPDCAAKKDPNLPCDCPVDAKGKMKCGAGKCGTATKSDKQMKCGAGKCGANK